MSNVRFYRLTNLPEFKGEIHQGIFVHLTQAGENGSPKAGLWFGGAAGWEYLTNDTNPESITNAINALDVPGYAQATITTAADSSTLTIKGIKEEDGKINEDTNLNFDVAIDGVYNNSSNKIATKSTVNDKIATLDASAFQTVTKSTSGVNTVLTFNGIKEVDGIISQGVTENAETFTVGNANLKIQIGSSAATNVFSANATEDSTIQLDGNVFKKNGDVISVITPTAVSDKNRLVTEKDVANLAGAMHYKGTVSSKDEFNNKLGDSDAEEAGDVYIATGIPEGSFTDNKGNVIENGDMIVFNGASEYTVVQSNLTLGINSGQIAKNDGNLTPNNIVVATSTGIKTIGISETDLTSTDNGNNTRTLSIANNGPENAALYHSVSISDNLKVIGKDFSKTINISSVNSSIEITKNPTEDTTGVMVDLVWNESI